MSASLRGVVISLHAYGAAVRLEDGRLASVPAAELERDRGAYERAFACRRPVPFAIVAEGAHTTAVMLPQIDEPELDRQITGFLKSTEDWTTPEGPPAHERHFLRKKRRAALFESHHAAD